MLKKLSILIIFGFLFQTIKAQNEFITIWKPSNVSPAVSAPSQAGNNQIWFPGTGENYTITWEEVGYPQHNGTIPDITSTQQVMIDFGIPANPDPTSATYRVKVSNGIGTFRHLKFGIPNLTIPPGIVMSWTLYGTTEKLINIEHWGNIHWDSMNAAFVECKNLQMTATDAPDLSGVEDASFMFHNAEKFYGNASMANWNTSKIKNFKSMFGYGVSSSTTTPPDFFNPPIGSWDTSSAENMSFMFNIRKVFNQNLNSWNVSNVKDFSYMFASCESYNQPLDQWDVSNATNISYMFHFIPVFNQSLATWDTSKVVNMEHIFHGNSDFNQPLETWDVSNVTNMNTAFTNAISFNQPLATWDTRKVTNMLSLFEQASSFNQSLETWNLKSLTSALWMISQSGLDCINYSKTLKGWAENSDTPNNIGLGPLSPFLYSSDVSNWRNILISKGWSLTGDNVGECRILGVSDLPSQNVPGIYPNPAIDFIHLKNIQGIKSYIISDMSGRIIMKDHLSQDFINVQALATGNYVLQLITKDDIQSFKFIKK